MRITLRLGLLCLGALVLFAGCRAPHSVKRKDWYEPEPGAVGNSECPPVEDIDKPGYQVPVYKTVEEPVYERRRTPIWGHKTVGVYAERRVPVTLPTYSPRCKCESEVTLWHRTERVQVGVKRVPACIGYKTERVKVGTCKKCVQTGWRTVEPACPCPTP